MKDKIDQIYSDNRLVNQICSRNIEFFFDKIKRKEYFALVRFGDGEIDQIMGKKRPLDGYGEEPNRIIGNELYESLIYKAENYYIGLLFKYVKYAKILSHPNSIYYFKIPRSLVNQDEKYFFDVYIFSVLGPDLTNKINFWNKFFDYLEKDKNMKINWICNEKIKKNPPEYINKFLFVRDGCWLGKCEDCRIEILNYIDKTEGELFMFSAGVFANVLIHNAWMRNKKNIYIDIGQVFDALVYVPEDQPDYWMNIYVKRGFISQEESDRIMKRWEGVNELYKHKG